MGRFTRIIVDKPREPNIHQVVENVLGTIQRNDHAAAQMSRDEGSSSVPEPFYPEVIGFPTANTNFNAKGFAGPARPLFGHGNYVGEDWTSGRRMLPGELMRDEDHRVLPVDGYDEAGYWHDFAYDQGWRDMYRALAEGYTNADAILNFHYNAIEPDRRFGQEARNADASLTSGAGTRLMARRYSESWVRGREQMIDRIQNDAAYRGYLNSLPPAELFKLTMPERTKDELGRLKQADERLKQAEEWGEQTRQADPATGPLVP